MRAAGVDVGAMEQPHQLTHEQGVQFEVAIGGHIDKASYIRGMLVFYEMGSLAVIEPVFLRGYVRFIVLASNIPIRMRGAGFDVDAVVDALLGYVMTGKRPKGAVVEAFFG